MCVTNQTADGFNTVCCFRIYTKTPSRISVGGGKLRIKFYAASSDSAVVIRSNEFIERINELTGEAGERSVGADLPEQA